MVNSLFRSDGGRYYSNSRNSSSSVLSSIVSSTRSLWSRWSPTTTTTSSESNNNNLDGNSKQEYLLMTTSNYGHRQNAGPRCYGLVTNSTITGVVKKEPSKIQVSSDHQKEDGVEAFVGMF